MTDITDPIVDPAASGLPDPDVALFNADPPVTVGHLTTPDPETIGWAHDRTAGQAVASAEALERLDEERGLDRTANIYDADGTAGDNLTAGAEANADPDAEPTTTEPATGDEPGEPTTTEPTTTTAEPQPASTEPVTLDPADQ